MTDAKNVNGSYVSDLQSHVIAICGNRSEEIAGRCQNNSLCQRYLLGVVYKVLNRKILSGETFCFPEKSLLLRAADWPTINFLGMYCYFPVIGLVNFV